MTESIQRLVERDRNEQEFFRRCDLMMDAYRDLERRKKVDRHAIAEGNPADFPVPEYSFQMGKNTVALAGYWHEMPYFRQHEQHIRGHLKDATIMVTEMARLAEGALKDKTVEIPDDFFEEVEKVAWENHVPVVCNDPHEHPRIKRTGIFRTELKDKDMQATELKVEAFLAALAITTGALGVGIYDKIKSRIEDVRMSRRSFVFGGAAAGVATLTAASMYGTILNVGLSQPYWRRDNSPVGAVMFDAEDYRDVATAYTIATLARTLPAKSRITVVYGCGHMRAIKHYLDNPKELAVKMAMYRAAYGDAIPESLVFTPTGTDVSRKHPDASWTKEQQDVFVQRKQKEAST